MPFLYWGSPSSGGGGFRGFFALWMGGRGANVTGSTPPSTPPEPRAPSPEPGGAGRVYAPAFRGRRPEYIGADAELRRQAQRSDLAELEALQRELIERAASQEASAAIAAVQPQFAAISAVTGAAISVADLSRQLQQAMAELSAQIQADDEEALVVMLLLAT